jgi:succinylarginine dihydrolase
MFEVNFDGLVGPTHNYGGLSVGNVASLSHRGLVSNPREAALQGLAKMEFLAGLGLPQAVLPPQERPNLPMLRRLGFSGSDATILATAAKAAPETFAACCSASSMWTANAATVAPSADAMDGRVHFTPANLASKFHRFIEPDETSRLLRALFPSSERFAHHAPIPSAGGWGDEGAANHTRFAQRHGEPGLHFFVYGHSVWRPDLPRPQRFPSRQALEASQAVARLHQLPPERVCFAQQNPEAIDSGVFHNDVISVGNENFFLCHELAFLDNQRTLEALARQFQQVCGGELQVALVPSSEVPLPDAVGSYLFNSQIVTRQPGMMTLVAPVECRESPQVHGYLERLVASGATPLREVVYLDLRQSMRNGGGPACLRLRVVLTADELACVPRGSLITPESLDALRAWVRRHYRDSLSPDDLIDPKLLEESRAALDELTRILGIGTVYDFQK